MKLKPHAGSVANRSGDRRIISASLTRKELSLPPAFSWRTRSSTNPRRKLGTPLGPGLFPQNPRIFPRCPRVFRRNPRTFPRCPSAFPRCPGLSPVVPWVPQKSQPFPPLCRLFPGNPSLFRHRASHSPGIPAIPPESQRLPEIPKTFHLKDLCYFSHFTAWIIKS